MKYKWDLCADDIREMFAEKLMKKDFVTDKSGVKTIEILGSSFIADDDHIFGELNYDYIQRELEWYKSQSLFVEDIPGGAPTIWKQVADEFGAINSNYGFLIWSTTNGDQYKNVVETLRKDPNSRRAVMIYTRPSMHVDYNSNGMSDFVCTNTVAYSIRDGKIHATVNMRSNDAIFGYKNDYAWQAYVLARLGAELEVEVGTIYWQTTSLHVYERHFYLVDYWAYTAETSVKKEDYRLRYPDSPWAS